MRVPSGSYGARVSIVVRFFQLRPPWVGCSRGAIWIRGGQLWRLGINLGCRSVKTRTSLPSKGHGQSPIACRHWTSRGRAGSVEVRRPHQCCVGRARSSLCSVSTGSYSNAGHFSSSTSRRGMFVLSLCFALAIAILANHSCDPTSRARRPACTARLCLPTVVASVCRSTFLHPLRRSIDGGGVPPGGNGHLARRRRRDDASARGLAPLGGRPHIRGGRIWMVGTGEPSPVRGASGYRRSIDGKSSLTVSVSRSRSMSGRERDRFVMRGRAGDARLVVFAWSFGLFPHRVVASLDWETPARLTVLRWCGVAWRGVVK
ncbi:hypothetical protein BJ875DRAFT_253439 [Amylocarpus encephaloides]|uniref:Uncharacterized protein n=1 Tax=Amylocarpus encephaloides TaxID=45428 RepID=A0A9P7Y620_9HELO|nr:hypothetical protein BJ875DRAFT_253439 [Amylocarpus encephaloides]